jgi:hypothetical protein
MRVQSRVKANLATCGSGCEHLARRSKTGFCHCVVLLVELKGDGVAGLGSNVCRLEGQYARATNYDPVILGGGGRAR